MPEVVAFIPARYDATRFPGKVLAAETGRPLIQHVWERAGQAASVDRVVIATDDERIRRAAENFGADVVMTRRDHPNGTCRIAEAAAGLSPRLVVNVQGDEPEIDPAVIDETVAHLDRHPDCVVGTAAVPLETEADAANPNIVKVVADTDGRALYFSRADIPHGPPGGRWRHVGLYVYRPDFLIRYVTWSPTPLEEAERLEQLRILEHGERIAVACLTGHEHAPGIDTPEQYAAFVERCRRRP